MSEALQLSVSMEDATDEEVASITRELRRWINDTAPDCEAREVGSGISVPGAKGADPVTLGALAVLFLQSGAFKALTDCLTTYISERRRKVKLVVKNAAGQSIELEAENLGQRELEDLKRKMAELAGEAPA